ncbi:MAG: hypothetical protein D6723_03995 [Acidobacteria bacterium]|nr:MAG: hypothetical protein D6723_03995 [Acidobacteriota bacterium]
MPRKRAKAEEKVAEKANETLPELEEELELEELESLEEEFEEEALDEAEPEEVEEAIAELTEEKEEALAADAADQDVTEVEEEEEIEPLEEYEEEEIPERPRRETRQELLGRLMLRLLQEREKVHQALERVRDLNMQLRDAGPRPPEKLKEQYHKAIAELSRARREENFARTELVQVLSWRS